MRHSTLATQLLLLSPVIKQGRRLPGVRSRKQQRCGRGEHWHAACVVFVHQCLYGESDANHADIQRGLQHTGIGRRSGTTERQPQSARVARSRGSRRRRSGSGDADHAQRRIVPDAAQDVFLLHTQECVQKRSLVLLIYSYEKIANQPVSFTRAVPRRVDLPRPLPAAAQPKERPLLRHPYTQPVEEEDHADADPATDARQPAPAPRRTHWRQGQRKRGRSRGRT
ncbi:hypothetical protein P3T25_008552 [Paraburkholderia sp. GAS32]